MVFICYFGSNGSVYLTVKDTLIRTAYKREQFDSNSLRFIEGVEKTLALKIIEINEHPNCLALINEFGNHEYVRCPLINNQIIELGDCFDCAMVAEHMAPRWSAHEELIDNPDLEKICLNCPNHMD